MENNQFIFKEKCYVLGEDNCNGIINDDESPINGLDLSDVIELLKHNEDVFFDLEYYDSSCESCGFGRAEKLKHFKFLEYHFYAFSKDGNYVQSSLSKEYEVTTLDQLFKRGIIDKCYLVSVIVCEHCGDFTIEMECGDY